MGINQFEETGPYADQETIMTGWGATPINVFGHDPRPMRLDSLLLTSDDTADIVVQLWGTYGGSTNSLLGSVLVPAGSGTDGVLPTIDAVPLVFPNLLTWQCDNNIGLAIVAVPLVTSGKHIWASAIGGYV